MTKVRIEFDYNGYEFKALGVLSDSGHVEAIRISPIGFEMTEFNNDDVHEIHEIAQDLLVETFYCPEMEFDL